MMAMNHQQGDLGAPEPAALEPSAESPAASASGASAAPVAGDSASSPHISAGSNEPSAAQAEEGDGEPLDQEGLETDPPPVWDTADAGEDADFASAETDEDAWAFLDSESAEPEARVPERRAASSLERTLAKSVFHANFEDVLSALLEARSVREPSAGGSPELRRLLGRAQTQGLSEPRLLSVLIRAQGEQDLGGAFPLICALLARRLALPSLRARPRTLPLENRLELIRGVRTAARQALRTRGQAILPLLPKLAARVGASAATRKLPLAELVPALRRELRRAERVEAAPQEFDDLPHNGSPIRRLRLPGRVEIVIYAK